MTTGVSAQTGVPQAPRAGLTISIRDANDGRPVPGAGVTLRSATGADIVTAASAADGIVRIGDLAAGQFTIQVAAPGYGASSAIVTVVAGQVSTRDITLTRTGVTVPVDNQVPRPPGVSTPDAELS